MPLLSIGVGEGTITCIGVETGVETTGWAVMPLPTVGVGEGTITCIPVGTVVVDECMASGVATGVATDTFVGGLGRVRIKCVCVGVGVAGMTVGSGVAKVTWDWDGAWEGVSTGVGVSWTATIMSDTFTESNGTPTASITQAPSFCFLAAKSYG